MANKRSAKKRRPAPKTVLRLPDLDQAKSAVLNTLSSRDAQRGYRHAMDEFIEWYCSEPRLSFSRTVVVRYRMHLESRKLAVPVTTTTSKLVYTLVFDNSMLADDAAREKDIQARTAQFTRALNNMKTLAEGGTVPPPATR